MNTSKLICLLCPTGCTIKLVSEDSSIKSIEGAGCKRGIAYATAEFISPRRILTATVRVYGGTLPVLPVKTSSPISKEKIRECMLELARTAVAAPIQCGTVIVHNILGTGADVIATRDIERE